MELGQADDEEVDEYNDVGFVEISNIFATYDAFVYGIVSFDRL